MLALVVAIVAGSVTVGAIFRAELEPYATLAAGVAVLAGFWLMLTARDRPIGAVYELGYDRGRHDGMRERNGRGPSGGGRLAKLMDHRAS